MVNSVLTVALTMFLLDSHGPSASLSGSPQSATSGIFSSPLGFADAKKMRKKKRRFNAD